MKQIKYILTLMAAAFFLAAPAFSQQKTITKPALPVKPPTTATSPRNPTPSRPVTSGYINGHEYVDLGLTVKWATCNVGASSPTEYGYYYAWGEIKTKSLFVEENSAVSNRRMKDIAGNAKYDTARANWDSTWRLPTADEMDELINKCKWVWTTIGGVNGYKITGANGSSIFLPASGCRKLKDLHYEGHAATYWCSTPYEKGTLVSYALAFADDSFGRNGANRCIGSSVRPVSD